ncbi:hypothetical protein RB195_019521 [Necator americanus]|uniref:Reverse transcriptase domain-containing protein n=1 Tax=Necator americanus TaxID=51031 RepID=A0ABR1CH63_NECAM
MYKVLERIILDRLISETTQIEQACFRLGRSIIGQVFIVRRLIQIRQRYSNPMQLAFLDFEAASDSSRLIEGVLPTLTKYHESSPT